MLVGMALIFCTCDVFVCDALWVLDYVTFYRLSGRRVNTGGARAEIAEVGN